MCVIMRRGEFKEHLPMVIKKMYFNKFVLFHFIYSDTLNKMRSERTIPNCHFNWMNKQIIKWFFHLCRCSKRFRHFTGFVCTVYILKQQPQIRFCFMFFLHAHRQDNIMSHNLVQFERNVSISVNYYHFLQTLYNWSKLCIYIYTECWLYMMQIY